MSLFINNLKTAVMLLLAMTVLSPPGAADERPKSPLPTVNRALLEMTKTTDSIAPILIDMHLPSESRAELWSMTGTFLPVIASIAIWKRQNPYRVQEYGPGGLLFREYYKEPDRTVPYVIMATGVIVGPSIGYLYGGCTMRGLKGILVRTATGAATFGLAYAVGKSIKSDGWMDFSGCAVASIIGTIGGGIIIIHSANDLGQVRNAVREQNQKRVKAYLSLEPQTFGPGNAPGLQLTLKF